MAGGADIHNELVNNMLVALRRGNKPPCKVYTENVKLELIKDDYYVYPDLMLTCDQADAQERYFKRSPSLLVEVLSSSTLSYDKGGKKFHHYLKIPSLKYYLLVSQEEIRVECFSKELSKEGWHYQVYEQMEDVIPLEQLASQLAVSDIYDNIGLIEA